MVVVWAENACLLSSGACTEKESELFAKALPKHKLTNARERFECLSRFGSRRGK